MRKWYWFLIVLLILGLALVIFGQYNILVLHENGFGWELTIYGTILLGLLLAIGALYFERWKRRWWER